MVDPEYWTKKQLVAFLFILGLFIYASDYLINHFF